MYYPPSPLDEVRLYLRNAAGVVDQIFTYPTKAAALKALGLPWIAENVREQFREFSHYERWISAEGAWLSQRRYREAWAVMRDAQGRPLDASDFRSLDRKYRPRGRRFGFDCWNGEGPVPRTGRPSGGHYFRRLGTMNERRLAQPVDPDEPAPRSARNTRNLPNSWDDYAVAAREVRNWKRHRRTQYKVAR